MDVLNKIKSAVTSALPGIPLSREFEISCQIASSGPGLLWKIYSGVKRSTKQEASIFALEKKQLDSYNRHDREYIVEIIKKGVSQLTRLRHPNILSVVHPLEETREMIAFGTEPVFASLSNILGNYGNLPTPIPKDLQHHKLYEVEIKYGLIQVLEALAFLHKDAKMIHRNISPSSIVVNRSGEWKLAGFLCAVGSTNPQDQAPFYPFTEWNPCKPPIIQPNLDYMAPEYALTLSNVPESDIFSFAILFYALFNDGRTLYKCNNQFNVFQQNAEELKKLRSDLGNIPPDMWDCLKLMLNTEPSVRPDTNQIAKMTFFTEDLGTVTLQYMDSLFQQDNLHKSQFFKGLTKVISKLPNRINQHRILPGLMKEAINPDMIPFLLPNIFLIAEQASDTEFMSLIFPGLVEIFRLQEPIQITHLLLQNMMLILSKTPINETRTHVLPMVYRALESQSVQIQELCLNIVPTFASMLEFTALRTSVIPRVKKICMTTSTLTARVNSLVCIGKLVEFMDKWSVQDEVIPFLVKVPSREPAVLMSILGICKVSFKHQRLGISKDTVVNTLLPILLPMAFDNNLNLTQFNAFMSIIHDMFAQVESEHRSKLEQMTSIQTEQKTIEFSKLASADDATQTSANKPDSMMDKFMSSTGLSSLFTTPAPAKTNTSPSRVTTTPVDAPTLPNQPSKVSLTIEEKQKLAKQQEQTKFYKSQTQTAIKPSSQSMVKENKSTTKDLTSTLMDRNMTNLSRSATISNTNQQFPSHPINSQSFPSQPMSIQPPWNQPMGSQGVNYSSWNQPMSSHGVNYSSSQFANFSPFASNNYPGGNQSKPDLSAFDKLLPSKENKKSLHEMSSTGKSTALPQNSQISSFGQNMQMTGAPRIAQPMSATQMAPNSWSTPSGNVMNSNYFAPNFGPSQVNALGQGTMLDAMGQMQPTGPVGQNNARNSTQQKIPNSTIALSKSDVDSLLG